MTFVFATAYRSTRPLRPKPYGPGQWLAPTDLIIRSDITEFWRQSAERGPIGKMGPRSSRTAWFRAAVVLCAVPILTTSSFAAAQTAKNASKDPCDPTYVPKKGETPPACPAVKDLVLERSDGAKPFAATPPPVEKPPPRAKTTTPPARAIVNSPAFRMQRDGSSKVFVQVHGTPSVRQITTRNGVVFVLTDCRVPVYNNRHALMTHYFNTPIADARLRQFRNDVHFNIDLRANATPTARLLELVPGQVSVLEVTFPPGHYYESIPSDPPRGRKRTAHGRRSRESRRDGGGVLGPPAP
ncbi:MAG: hypothetical protein BWY17_02540 [Deltaproteobacteria bacterium ADurb.Bin207]|nr:MAG: hypothetical protein BWY17_02540 [Deltaproteobacteria bacterium ADurb.Bin207]